MTTRLLALPAAILALSLAACGEEDPQVAKQRQVDNEAAVVAVCKDHEGIEAMAPIAANGSWNPTKEIIVVCKDQTSETVSVTIPED